MGIAEDGGRDIDMVGSGPLRSQASRRPAHDADGSSRDSQYTTGFRHVSAIKVSTTNLLELFAIASLLRKYTNPLLACLVPLQQQSRSPPPPPHLTGKEGRLYHGTYIFLSNTHDTTSCMHRRGVHSPVQLYTKKTTSERSQPQPGPFHDPSGLVHTTKLESNN